MSASTEAPLGLVEASGQPSGDTFKTLDQYPDLNVAFSAWEITEIRQSWASMRDDQSEIAISSVPMSCPASSAGTRETVGSSSAATAFFCQQFYENLLGEYPELSVMFPSIKSQASRMAGMLTLVISQLDNLTRVRDVLISLGKRHSRIIGVEVTHYELVGNALLRTLSDRIQDEFTPEVENAWIKFFTYITNMMLQAGEDPPLPAVLPESILYPVLTPISSNHSESVNAEARRALKPRISPAAVPTAASSVITPSGISYAPATSHFKPVHNNTMASGSSITPAGKQKKKRGGKGQDCTIM